MKYTELELWEMIFEAFINEKFLNDKRKLYVLNWDNGCEQLETLRERIEDVCWYYMSLFELNVGLRYLESRWLVRLEYAHPFINRATTILKFN